VGERGAAAAHTRHSPLWFALAGLLLLAGACSDRSGNLPGSLGGMELGLVAGGQEARAVLERMHGVPLPGAEHLIAGYGGPADGATLYLSTYPDEERASADLRRMAARLAAGTPVFSPLEAERMGPGVRFRTEGLGFRHLFYRQGRVLLWLQAPPDHAGAAEADLQAFDFAAARR
jgi:hypothetical protein